MSPLQEYMRTLGYILLPTVEQGGCGIDAMAFWDGAPRTETTWKALRLEVSSALEVGAEDPLWQAALAGCGELPSITTTASGTKSPSSPWALAPAQCSSEPPSTGCDAKDAESTVRYFCGFLPGREEPAVDR